MLPEAFHDISGGKIAADRRAGPVPFTNGRTTTPPCEAAQQDCGQGQWPWDKIFLQHTEEIETLNQSVSYLLEQMNSKHRHLD